MAFVRHRYAELKILIAAIVAQKEAGGTEGNKAEETASNNFLLELQTQIETVDAFVAKQNGIVIVIALSSWGRGGRRPRPDRCQRERNPR